jgi:hypothetical protein
MGHHPGEENLIKRGELSGTIIQHNISKPIRIATLLNEAIKLAENNANLSFVSSFPKVLLPNGQTGYVSNRYIYTRSCY